jgi:thiol-disulfide isomerase/thioredoxin
MKACSMLLSLLTAFATLSLKAGPAQAGRHPETLRQGDVAPDFTLQSPDGRQSVHLADLRGQKPVVLIFGSYTCPPFRDVYPSLERLHQAYGDRVAFYYVYIREAHAEDGWKMPRNRREGIAISDPKTMAERNAVAGRRASISRRASRVWWTRWTMPPTAHMPPGPRASSWSTLRVEWRSVVNPARAGWSPQLALWRTGCRKIRRRQRRHGEICPVGQAETQSQFRGETVRCSRR